MSFRILTLQLTGKLKSVEKLEAERAALQKNYAAFIEAGKSATLAEYRELENWVGSGAMQQRKKELEGEVFKGSSEYLLLKELDTLKKIRSIRDYFKVEGSAELQRFMKVKDSDLLKEYYQLKDYVEGGAFQRDKQAISLLKFHGSAEEKHLHEFEEMKKNHALQDFLKLQGSEAITRHHKFIESPKFKRYLELKNLPVADKAHKEELDRLAKDHEVVQYFKLENSKEFRHYKEMSGSHLPARYKELHDLVGSRAFRDKVSELKDKKKFEKSEAMQKYKKFKQLASVGDIRFFLKYEKSSLYRNYLDTKDSYPLQRYRELVAQTTSPEFLKRKAWLEDTKKWEKSEEYARHQRFMALKKDPKVELFFKFQNSHAFDFFNDWEESFSEEFGAGKPDWSKWTPNNYLADLMLGEPFSQKDDLQAYTGGKNCSVSNGRLQIHVRKEKVISKAWHPGAGFVPVEFHYTSDILSTVKSFWQEGGIFEAKIRFSPVNEVVSTCYLQGKKNSPLISLLEMGPTSRMGILTLNGTGKPEFNGITLQHLKKDHFYMFRVEWDSNRVIWKINDIKVHEVPFGGLGEPAHISMQNLVVSEIPGSKLPVTFETDWIRCYRRKQNS